MAGTSVSHVTPDHLRSFNQVRRSASPPTLPFVEPTRVCKLNVRACTLQRGMEGEICLAKFGKTHKIKRPISYMRWTLRSKIQGVNRSNKIITIQHYIESKYKQTHSQLLKTETNAN